MKPAFVYVLHFFEPFHHAQHYVGMTYDLRSRLLAHALGRGARLTAVLCDFHRPWRLSGLFQVRDPESVRRLERMLKRQKNTHRYCELCCLTPEPLRLPGTDPYPLDAIGFPLNSVTIMDQYRFLPKKEEQA